MHGQTKFPVGFGCDPTLLSGNGLPRAGLNPQLGNPAPVTISPAVLPSPAGHRLPKRRLAEIETQATRSPRTRSLSTLWTSAALGAALASSLYFLNYF